MARIECFFDCSSPWTYLAFEGLQSVAERCGEAIDWRPILVGGVFNTVNPSVYEARSNPVPAKARYAAKDLQDWARFQGLVIGSPEPFPVNSVKVMRGCLVAAESGALVPFARAAFRAYWSEERDISRTEEVRAIAGAAGLDADALTGAIADDAVKARLRANTDELVERGGFGSPTIFVDGDDMYFGNDRMPLIEAALRGGRGA